MNEQSRPVDAPTTRIDPITEVINQAKQTTQAIRARSEATGQ